MSTMGRYSVEYERQLLLKVDAAEEMFDWLKEYETFAREMVDDECDKDGRWARLLAILAKVEGRS